MPKGHYSDSVFSDLSNSSTGRKTVPKIKIEGRFFLKSAHSSHSQYMMYKGVDAQKTQWVNIYVKRADNPYKWSNSFPETVRNQITPKILWAGEVKSSTMAYYTEVHQKLGPSVKELFKILKRWPKEKEIHHLLLQMIKLVQKLNSFKLICGEMTPDMIIFDSSPSKKQLYLLNTFKLKKRQITMKPLKTKYCSRGAHLGRSLNTKDDLESICYILMDVFLQGQFLEGKQPSEYEEIKLSGNIQKLGSNLPKILVQFYYYITSLNWGDQINFFHWKNYLIKNLSCEYISKPYSFMFSQSQQIKQYDLLEQQSQFSWNDLEEEEEEEKINRNKKLQENYMKINLQNKHQSEEL